MIGFYQNLQIENICFFLDNGVLAFVDANSEMRTRPLVGIINAQHRFFFLLFPQVVGIERTILVIMCQNDELICILYPINSIIATL